MVEAGLFRTDIGRSGELPMGCEETELAIRIGMRNPKMRFRHATESIVRHYVPASRATLPYFLRRCWAEGRSKALMARSVPRSKSLASEIAYLRWVLLGAILRRSSTSVPDQVRQTGATVVGLAAFASGYLFEDGSRAVRMAGSNSSPGLR
jgi:hypothetical protein